MSDAPLGDIRQATLGGWFDTRAVTVKAAYGHFNALDVYFEQEAFVSVGSGALRWVSVSAELRARRVGLCRVRDERESLVECGLTVFVPRRHASVQVAVDHLLLEDASVPGVRAPVRVLVGVHSTRQRFGALGVVAETVVGPDPLVRVSVGSEFRFCRALAVNVALTTQPFMIGFGATVEWRRYGTAVALVHHPALGWSQGFTVDCARPGRR